MYDFPYPGKYTFVDVEIPNLNNDCICAISMIVVEDQKEVLRHTELINPKTFFSANNIEIHHIHRKDVLDARTIEEFWADYGHYFDEGYIIGAHNTLSDVSVLNKDLARYGKKIQATHYIDTMAIMEKFYYKGKQKKGDLKLCNIADHLGIEIDHHNPESDVNACYEIVRYMARYFAMDLSPFVTEIPEPKHKHHKNDHKPSRRQMKIFLAFTRRQIATRAPNTLMNAKSAKILGDKAFKANDYEGIIFHYELALARHWSSPGLYLRLAQTYDSLNMYYDAVRVLDQGIRNLKAANQDWHILKGVQSKFNDLRTSRLEKQKAQASRKLVDQASHSSRSAEENGEEKPAKAAGAKKKSRKPGSSKPKQLKKQTGQSSPKAKKPASVSPAKKKKAEPAV